MKTLSISIFLILTIYIYWCYKDIRFEYTEYITTLPEDGDIIDLNHNFPFDENVTIYIKTLRPSEKIDNKTIRAVLVTGTGKKWSINWEGLYDPYEINLLQKRVDEFLKPLKLTTRKHGQNLTIK